jgi:hypothetical protein
VFLSGWLGLGTIEEPVVSEFTDPRPSFVPFTEFSGYNRAPVTFGPALTGRIDRFPAPTAPARAVITHGALYDSEGGARYLLLWPWLPQFITAGPETMFPPLEVVIAWTTPVQHLLNSSEHPDYPDKITIDRGREIGTWNNRPITAARKLAALGGTLVARAAATRRAAA